MKRIDTAVILTARKEFDCELPYPLMPIGETCLIERTIAILLENRFTNIILVVGYRADLFDRYASDYVKVVVNYDYAIVGSMGSLTTASSYIDSDFLLIDGDLFFEKSIIGEMAEVNYPNCLSVTQESGNGGEAFVETKNGFVTKITKDRRCIVRFSGEMLGITKISKDTFLRMIDLWSKCDNPYLNYEYALYDVTDDIDRPYKFFSNIIWGDVDCHNDYQHLIDDVMPVLRHKEDPYDKDNVASLINSIVPEVDPTNIEITKIGGMSNRNFKIDVNDAKFALRLLGNGAKGMVDRKSEFYNSVLASELGINVNTIYFNEDTGVKLTQYIDDAETLNPATIQRPENIKKVAYLLRSLHSSNTRQDNEFNPFTEIIKYEHLLEQTGMKMFDGWNEIRKRVFGLKRELNLMGVALRPCHNDLVPENFIKDSEGNIFLIDWEYSGMNDPICDLATLFLESNFSLENQELFLKMYYKGDLPENIYRKIAIYQTLLDCLWSIWALIKTADGADFTNYGYNRFQRAVKSINSILPL